MKIKRDEYLKELIDSQWDGQIKVITGLRRSGKSYMLKTLFRDSFETLDGYLDASQVRKRIMPLFELSGELSMLRYIPPVIAVKSDYR